MTFEELKQLTEQGDAKAMLELGKCYYQGNGVERHLTNAIAYWISASESNEPAVALEACQYLVQHYIETKELVEAEKWASKEKDFGSSVGMVHVAMALCEKKEISGLNLLLSLARDGDEQALNVFPNYVNRFLEAGIELTPEMKDFINATYKTESVSTESTNRKPLSKWNKIKGYFALAIIAVIVIWFLWSIITPTVVVIESGNKHRIENVLGSLKVLNSEGKEIELNNLKLFTRYVYNGTDSVLICYNVLYSNSESGNDAFKEEYYLVKSNEVKAVDELPDFYFEEPESIEVKEHWLLGLFSGLFGDGEVKWVIEDVSNIDISSLSTQTILEFADLNNIAQYYLALRYLAGEDLPADTLKAFEWMQKSASQGYVGGEVLLGLMYNYGLGTAENPEQAFEYMKRASSKNDAEAHWYLAKYYYNGYGIKQDVRKYREYIEYAAQGGYVYAFTELALNLLEEGEVDKAAEWLDKAIIEQTSNINYMAEAGFAFINMGSEERIEQGYRYLQYAAEHDEEDAVAVLKKYPTLDSLKRSLKSSGGASQSQ